MPNVGWGELLVIGLIGLLVFGPNKLPEMMRSFGKALRSFQEESGRAMQQLRDATDLSDVDAPVSEVGVIDRPDGYEPAATTNGESPPIVLYNRNPAGLMPGEEPPEVVEAAPASAEAPAKKRAAHAPKKRSAPAKKTAAPRKTTTAATKKKTPAAKRSLQAHEDT